MNIVLDNAGKRYGNEWIFRHATLTLSASQPTVVMGGNGSGKSTFLRLLSSAIYPTEGSVSYKLANKQVEPDYVFRYVSMAAPYMELIEEYTLKEQVTFHAHFKTFIESMQTQDVLNCMQLENAANKQISLFSSGMKQRLRLALAILSDTPLLLLDEPCSNLDVEGKKWYASLIEKYTHGRLVVVCSNAEKEEHFFCTNEVDIRTFKNP